jgi:hypothetical protein
VKGQHTGYDQEQERMVSSTLDFPGRGRANSIVEDPNVADGYVGEQPFFEQQSEIVQPPVAPQPKPVGRAAQPTHRPGPTLPKPTRSAKGQSKDSQPAAPEEASKVLRVKTLPDGDTGPSSAHPGFR